MSTDDFHGFVSIGAHCVVEKRVGLGNTVVFDGSNLTQGIYNDCLVSDEFCVHIRE